MANIINLQPSVCNICGGRVIHTTNDKIYNGRKYGNGYCYLCTNCWASVGTHKDNPQIALGILANKEMKNLKIKCHDLFDSFWTTSKQRKKEYKWLADQLGISVQECHFGYFDLDMLNKALVILQERKENDKR